MAQQSKSLSSEDTVAVIADLENYDLDLISRTGKKGESSLELISRYETGYNTIDIEAVTGTPKKRIPLFRQWLTGEKAWNTEK